MEKKPLEMCMDVPLDLGLTKSITQLKGLNEKNNLWLTWRVDLMKDDKRSPEVAKESDVHVKLIGGVDMLTRK